MAKMKDYIDKEHAVGMLECQERHLKRISDLLDECGVPCVGLHEKPLTVAQRVEFVLTVLGLVTPGEVLVNALTMVEKIHLTPDYEGDPEEIIEFIYSEGDFNG